MGAKGLVPLVVAVLCAMVYRGRTQVRPELVAAVLLAAAIWLLEKHRSGDRRALVWLVPIAVVWANTHISYYLLLGVILAHAVGATLPGGDRDGARALWLSLLATSVALLANPFGARYLGQPFHHFLDLRNEAIFRAIGELRPVHWSASWRNGLPLLLAGWPLLALVRSRRERPDWAEWLICGSFTASVFVGARFVGPYAVAAFPYISRDLDDWLRRREWPRWTRPAPTRAALAAASCLVVAAPEMTRGVPIRMHLDTTTFSPVAACDFIESRGLRGRFYNPYPLGGYMVYRFWPERDRLPFMSAHLEGTPELRALYMGALENEAGWRSLDAACRFDVLLLWQNTIPSDELPMTLDRDGAWARVFGDDIACVYVRRDGPFAALARDSAYVTLPSDPRNIAAVGHRSAGDTDLRQRLARELWRQVAASPRHAWALDMLANLAIEEERWDDARRLERGALAVQPLLPGARDKLGVVELIAGRPREALRWFEEERRISGSRRIEFRRGQVAAALGDLGRARACYLRQLTRDPGDAEARDSLRVLAGRSSGSGAPPLSSSAPAL